MSIGYPDNMVTSPDAAPPGANMSLELHKIISRMSRDHGDPKEMATLGEAAGRIILLEQAVRNLLSLMENTSRSELHASVRNARTLVGGP